MEKEKHLTIDCDNFVIWSCMRLGLLSDISKIFDISDKQRFGRFIFQNKISKNCYLSRLWWEGNANYNLKTILEIKSGKLNIFRFLHSGLCVRHGAFSTKSKTWLKLFDFHLQSHFLRKLKAPVTGKSSAICYTFYWKVQKSIFFKWP